MADWASSFSPLAARMSCKQAASLGLCFSAIWMKAAAVSGISAGMGTASSLPTV